MSWDAGAGLGAGLASGPAPGGRGLHGAGLPIGLPSPQVCVDVLRAACWRRMRPRRARPVVAHGRATTQAGSAAETSKTRTVCALSVARQQGRSAAPRGDARATRERREGQQRPWLAWALGLCAAPVSLALSVTVRATHRRRRATSDHLRRSGVAVRRARLPTTQTAPGCPSTHHAHTARPPATTPCEEARSPARGALEGN